MLGECRLCASKLFMLSCAPPIFAVEGTAMVVRYVHERPAPAIPVRALVYMSLPLWAVMVGIVGWAAWVGAL